MRNGELVRQRTEYLNLRGLFCFYRLNFRHYIPLQWMYDILILVSNEPKVVPTESCRYDIHILC